MSTAAREAACKLIQKYVDRDESEKCLKFLQDGQMGSTCPGRMSAMIGGWMPVGVKRWSADWILVNRDVTGKEVNEAFRLRDIFEECKHRQLTLL